MKRIIFLILIIVSINTTFAVNQMELIWQTTGEHISSAYGTSVISLDYNADGNDDLVVNSAQFNHPGAGGNGFPYHKGKLYFYYGSPNFANELQPDLTLLRSSIEDTLNAILYLRTADLNGDGLKDLVCYKSANYEIQLYSGISVFYSGTDCDSIPDFNYTFYDENCVGGPDYGHLWETIGDVNGDGCEDLGFVYVEKPYPSTIASNQFYILYGDPVSPHLEYIATWGANVPFGAPKIRGIGNINNDAYDDFIIGYFNTELNKTVNAIIYGNTVIDTIITPSQILDIGEYSVNPFCGGAYCGDINGDGADDFIGDWHEPIYPKIWLGGNTNFNSSSLILDGQCYMGVGFSYGDINNDGYDDIIFGNMNMINSYGNLWIYLGGENPNASCDLVIQPPFVLPLNARMGYSTTTGDFNCDGIPDIAAGAPCLSYNEGRGYVFIYAGNTNILETTVANDIPEPLSNVIFKAYPNPFNPNVNFEIKTESHDQPLFIDIFNIKGQKIETLRLSSEQQKNEKVQWNSDHLSSGIYICQLRSTQKLLSSRKISLIK